EDALGWGGDRYVSVNISPMEFRTSDLVQRVADVLAKSGLPATRLELEITENVTFEHPQHALEVMQGLRSLGVRLTVDDFGTGYA
ncbi:EAL domain-containing protein, partial [Pseudomonas sp. SIMBA_067]